MNEVVNEAPLTEEQSPAEVVIEAAPASPKPGEKTDPARLLESLQKEREKRQQLEIDLETERLKNQQRPEIISDEGKLLLNEIEEVKKVVFGREQRDNLSSLEAVHPALKDKSEEFEQFRTDNPGMRLDTAAKAFLIENDLMDVPQPRKGLEQAQGGGRTPVQQDGLSPEEADQLRVNNYSEYVKRIKAGTLKIRT